MLECCAKPVSQVCSSKARQAAPPTVRHIWPSPEPRSASVLHSGTTKVIFPLKLHLIGTAVCLSITRSDARCVARPWAGNTASKVAVQHVPSAPPRAPGHGMPEDFSRDFCSTFPTKMTLSHPGQGPADKT